MSYEIDAARPVPAPWSEDAVVALIGLRPRVNGRPAEVIAACQRGGEVLVRIRLSNDTLPLPVPDDLFPFVISGLPVDGEPPDDSSWMDDLFPFPTDDPEVTDGPAAD